MVSLRCPICGRVFCRMSNQIHLARYSKYGCTCCSSKCRGKLYRAIQLHGLTHTMETAISANILASYRDIRGETTPRKPTYEGFRRDYTQSTCNGEDIVQTATLVLLMVTETWCGKLSCGSWVRIPTESRKQYDMGEIKTTRRTSIARMLRKETGTDGQKITNAIDKALTMEMCIRDSFWALS